MKRTLLIPLISVVLVLSMMVAGVSAMWFYFTDPSGTDGQMSSGLGNFRYGTLYITDIKVSGGQYSAAQAQKTGDTKMSTDLTLTNAAASSVVVDITFYNSTEVSYYYKQTDELTFSNSNMTYTISGIEQKDEIKSKTYKTITVTFSRKTGAATSVVNLNSELEFIFVVDKSSIGEVVAQTALDRFRDILNNVVSPNSYQTLENAMNNRSGWNKASAVTYIGNVEGSNSSDSTTIANLFGSEFMSMDLDGDGKKEPITMMIKRLDLDNNSATGDDYSYVERNTERTVYGAEMTLYITSQNLSNVNNGADVVVYAATFTKLPGNTQWTQLTPLTKGKADANNYNGYGSANSFNTDTWVADSGKTLEKLVQEALKSN